VSECCNFDALHQHLSLFSARLGLLERVKSRVIAFKKLLRLIRHGIHLRLELDLRNRCSNNNNNNNNYYYYTAAAATVTAADVKINHSKPDLILTV